MLSTYTKFLDGTLLPSSLARVLQVSSVSSPLESKAVHACVYSEGTFVSDEGVGEVRGQLETVTFLLPHVGLNSGCLTCLSPGTLPSPVVALESSLLRSECIDIEEKESVEVVRKVKKKKKVRN